MCCHLVCGCGETKSPCKSYAGKKRPKKGKHNGHQIMHGTAIWKPRISKIAKASRGSAPYEHSAARANMVTFVGLWPTAIKLNPSWKTDVSKSAWIKPWGTKNFGISWSFIYTYQTVFLCLRLEQTKKYQPQPSNLIPNKNYFSDIPFLNTQIYDTQSTKYNCIKDLKNFRNNFPNIALHQCTYTLVKKLVKCFCLLNNKDWGI